MEQSRNGGRAAREKLILRHQAWIDNIAVRMVLKQHDAEEVTQEVVVKVITAPLGMCPRGRGGAEPPKSLREQPTPLSGHAIGCGKRYNRAMAKRPKHQHAIKRGEICDWPDGVGTPGEVAERVTYRGSPLHKSYPSPAGPPALPGGRIQMRFL